LGGGVGQEIWFDPCFSIGLNLLRIKILVVQSQHWRHSGRKMLRLAAFVRARSSVVAPTHCLQGSIVSSGRFVAFLRLRLLF